MKSNIFTTFTLIATLASAAAESPLAKLDWKFDGQSSEQKWTDQNDRVMGGLSEGRVAIKEGSLIFSGKLSFKNNGGFASVMTNEQKYNLAGATHFKLRLKGDGRTYRLRISTDALHRGSSIVYLVNFPTKAGEWQELEIPMAAFKPSHHGDALDGPPLDLSKIEGIGLLIGDKQPEAFSLEVDWMKAE